MTRVKKELQFLKERAIEHAGKLVNDDAVTNLQRQIGWFKNEAIQLDKHLENQKKEFQNLKNKTTEAKNDNVYLRKEVKDAMKNNKLLEVAFNKTKAQSAALREFLKRNHLI